MHRVFTRDGRKFQQSVSREDLMEPKTWTKQEVVDLMLATVRRVALECAQLGQAYRIEDAIEQIFVDLNERGLIELTS